MSRKFFGTIRVGAHKWFLVGVEGSNMPVRSKDTGDCYVSKGGHARYDLTNRVRQQRIRPGRTS